MQMSIRTSHDFIVPLDTIINLFHSGCFVIVRNTIIFTNVLVKRLIIPNFIWSDTSL